MASSHTIGQTYLAEFVEKGFEICIICKPLHQTDTERAAHGTHLNGESIRRIGLCVHLADVLFGSTQISLADVTDTGCGC